MASTAPSATLLNTQLSAENVALKDELRVLRSEFRSLALANARLADKNEELIATQAQLKAALEHMLSKRPRRDLVDPNQGSLFVQEVQALADSIGSQDSECVDPVAELSPEDQQVPDGESPSDPEPKPKPKGKKREPSRRVADESNLRHEVVRSELPLEQRRCAVTGLELVEVGVKVTKELDYRPGELVVLEHHQVIYGAPPEVAKDRKIEQVFAPASPVAVEGVTASAPLLAWLVGQKYVLHLPLYRMEQVFAQYGVRVSRQTLCDWVLKLAFTLTPVRNEIERQVRAGPVLGLDDTIVKSFVVQEDSGRRKLKQAYLWAFVNPAVTGVVFRFALGRGTHDLASLLMTPEVPSSVEVILSDGLGTNRSGAREAGLKVEHAGCWAHVLRKFRDAACEGPATAKLVLESIAAIYEVEKRGRDRDLSPEALGELRRLESTEHVIRALRMTSGWKEHY